MKIQDGYNSQPFEIIINGRAGEKTMELWFIDLEQEARGKKDYLLYITIEEARELRDALNKAIKKTLGL